MVHRAGEESVEFCNQEAAPAYPGAGLGCDADRDLGIEYRRVDVVRHRKLRPYKLIGLNPRMRAVFEMFFDLEHPRLRGRDRCVTSYTLAPKIPAPDIQVEAPHCLIKVIGGFVHPKGERVLVKIEMDWEGDDEAHRTTYGAVTYQLSRL